MEENRLKALVMQTTGDTALLLCKGGQLLRTKNTAGWKVGEEITCDAVIPVEKKTEQKAGNIKLIKTLAKIAACFIVLISAVFASRVIPVHSEQLMDCIEVKTNIYGKVIAAQAINDQGKEILDVIDSSSDSDDYKTGNVADYLATIKNIMANLGKDSPISELAGTDEFADYYDDIPEELKQQAEEAIASGDQELIGQISQDIKEEITRELYKTNDEEFQLAYDMFGYRVVRTEYYSLGSEGHDMIPADITHADDIYLPFWAINMQTENREITDTITLSFDYKENDTIADFSMATVYLYDLTDKKETNSGIRYYRGYFNPVIDEETKAAYSTEVLVDSYEMVAYHTYYIKLNGVTANNNGITNINYVFEYVPEGSMGFRYWGDPVLDGTTSGSIQDSSPQDTSQQDTSQQDSSSQSSLSQNNIAEDTAIDTVNDESSSEEVIVWKDPAVEAIARLALGKENGAITKKEAADYTSWMLLYRNDIKTMEDIVWFTNINALYVRADLIKDASILPKSVQLYIFFDGLSDFTDIGKSCNVNEINKVSWLGVILREDGATGLYSFGKEIVSLQFKNNFKDYSKINTLLVFNNLNYIDLSYNGITDISWLGCLSEAKHLNQLSLDYNNLTDISVLKKLNGLFYLSLISNRIEDISSLSGMTALSTLCLDNNKVIDVSPLRNLTNLNQIILSNNKIKDISSLSNLNPSYLDLRNNDITDIRCMKNMKQLEYLCLLNNLITDISSLANLSNTATVILDGNMIKEWSPVEHIADVSGRQE